MGTIVNKSDFEKLFDDMRENVRIYENRLSDYDVDIYLADGRKIRYCVPNFCVPHLLGVNINYLESTGLFEKQNAYPLLKEMLANGYRVYWDGYTNRSVRGVRGIGGDDPEQVYVNVDDKIFDAMIWITIAGCFLEYLSFVNCSTRCNGYFVII